MDWTAENITAVAGAVTTILLAIFSKQILEFVMSVAKFYREGSEKKIRQRLLDDELNDKGYKWVIKRQDKRITELEDELEIIRSEHLKCREEYSALKMQNENLTHRVSILESKREQEKLRRQEDQSQFNVDPES